MNRLAVMVLAAIALSTGVASAQTSDDAIERASPWRRARRGWGDGHQVEAGLHLRRAAPGHQPPRVLRPVGRAQRAAVLVQCTSVGNLDRVAQNKKFEADPDKAREQPALDAAEKDNQVEAGVQLHVLYTMSGAIGRVRARCTRRWRCLARPRNRSGCLSNGKIGGVWIMNAGTTTAHLMIPGG